MFLEQNAGCSPDKIVDKTTMTVIEADEIRLLKLSSTWDMSWYAEEARSKTGPWAHIPLHILRCLQRFFVREAKTRDTFKFTNVTDLPACFVSAKADIIHAITVALGGNVVNLVKVEDEALGQVFAGQLSCDGRVESHL